MLFRSCLLMAGSVSHLRCMAADLQEALSRVGLRVTFAESFWCSSHAVCEPLKSRLVVNNIVVPYVCAQTGQFKHLGATLSLDGRCQISLQARLECGWRAFFTRSDVWRSKAPLADKLQVLHQVVQPCVLYGSESWSLTSAQRRSLDAALHSMVRRIMGLRRRPTDQGLEPWLDWWRRTARAARQAWTRGGYLPWSSCQRQQKWRWAGVLACAPSPARLITLWRGVEWTREQFRSEGSRRVKRDKPGKPVRWENSLHAFWEARGLSWSSADLWAELEDHFVARVL